MTNREMAAMLFNIATLLRDREDNPYRIRAYENGARALMGRQDDAARQLAQGSRMLEHRKGVLGERVQRKLKELAQTGEMSYFEELCADLPPYLRELMHVPGIGPKSAKHVHEVLGIETLDQLVQAARDGRLQSVWGFGAKRTSDIGQLSLFDDQDLWANGQSEAPRLAA